MASRTEQERVPVLKDRASFPDWERKFNDFATGEKLHDIMKGIEVAPVELTPQELQLIPAASRYLATSDRTKKIDYYADRNNRAFAAITKAMEKDMIYGSAALDNLRDTVPRDSAAAYQLVMDTLKPSHVDAQMTVEALITTLKLNEGETPPALIQRLATYVQRLPAQSRPDDITMMKTFKRALKSSSSVWPNYREKVESLMDQEPAVSYAVFCDRIQRKHDQLLEERAQDAALHTEAKQNMKHADNEEESAHYTKGKKGKGSGRGKSGKGGRGDGRQMGKGYDDAMHVLVPCTRLKAIVFRLVMALSGAEEDDMMVAEATVETLAMAKVAVAVEKEKTVARVITTPSLNLMVTVTNVDTMATRKLTATPTKRRATEIV